MLNMIAQLFVVYPRVVGKDASRENRAGDQIMKSRTLIPLAEMPFYGSLERARAATGLETATLLQSQVGFAASPASCACGDHEWSMFDMMSESVGRGAHDWSFYSNRDYSRLDTFFSSQEQLTCPTCNTKADVVLRYPYGGHIYTDPKS